MFTACFVAPLRSSYPLALLVDIVLLRPSYVSNPVYHALNYTPVNSTCNPVTDLILFVSFLFEPSEDKIIASHIVSLILFFDNCFLSKLICLRRLITRCQVLL